jgi:mono/diheme cytochrome c family protein
MEPDCFAGVRRRLARRLLPHPGRTLLGAAGLALIASAALAQTQNPMPWSTVVTNAGTKWRVRWGPPPDPRPAQPPISYTRDVAPILQANCQECHRPGGIGPFSLLTYTQAKTFAGAIKYYTGKKIMPPWKAAQHYGEFEGERRLSDEQIQTLAQWVDKGTPEGNPKDLPSPRQFTDGWRLGTPDLVLDAGAPVTLRPNVGDVYQNIVMPYSPDSDQWVTAMEVLPGNRSVVHHVNIYLDPRGVTPALDRAAPGPGFPSSGVGASFPGQVLMDVWQPGTTAHLLPEGTAWMIPAHSYIVVEVHYSPTAKAAQDRTVIGLHFARGPIDKRVRTADLGNIRFRIPPGVKRYVVPAGGTLPHDITVLSVLPHMHLIAREMKATATLPGGIAKPLIWIQDWDVHWQLSYVYKEPLKLPKGSRMDMQGVYDNSAGNPNNPFSPPRMVTFGPKASDEMCYLYFRYTVDEEHLTEGQRVDDDEIEGEDLR